MKFFLGSFCTLLLTSSVFGGTYGGGTGYADNPYVISSPAHLLELCSTPADWIKNFKLANDIDMSSCPPTAYIPIGNWNTYFNGTFDGQNHAICNLKFTTTLTGGVGVFGVINLGTVKNLGLKNIKITCSASSVGAMAGSMYGGTITNCYSIADIVTGNNKTSVGGFVGGFSNGSITYCRSAGSVTAGTSCQGIGGLIGEFSGGTFNNCSSTCTVTAPATTMYVGGLVGKQVNATQITNCFAAGSVTGGSIVGGLVGSSITASQPNPAISNCYSVADVHMAASSQNAGGLVGYCETSKIANCFSAGTVWASDQSASIGGFIGSIIAGSLTNCFSSASVSGGLNCYNLGGFAGQLLVSTTSSCYSTGPVTSSGGATGSTTQMIGGFVGFQDQGTTSNCYSTSPVTGGPDSRWVGGFLGYFGNNIGTIDKCFAAGPVSGTLNVSGLIGAMASGTCSASVFDAEVTGQPANGYGKGKTTAQMQDIATFTNLGWDFTSTWEMNSCPVLQFQPSIGFTGNTAIDLTANQSGQLTIQIFSTKNQALNWSISGAEDWIVANVAPLYGTSNGPDDKTTVTISINPGDLPIAHYATSLIITADNGDYIIVPIKINVFDRINFVELATMASNWTTTGCIAGQPCKAVDYYVDGNINMTDLALLAQGWLTDHVDKVLATAQDSFETGDFTALNWTHSGNVPWTVVSTSPYNGTFCARSGEIGNSQTSTLQLSLDTTGWEIDSIGFAVKFSAENGYDYLRFYIDGALKESWTGTTITWWNWKDYTITPGPHTFTWTYTKDDADSAGSDCGLIDGLRIYKR